MKLQAESTQTIATINGVPARLWAGVTENGVECHLYVTRIAVKNESNCEEFERDLHEHTATTIQASNGIPLRLII